jgi:hypothetical protein
MNIECYSLPSWLEGTGRYDLQFSEISVEWKLRDGSELGL